MSASGCDEPPAARQAATEQRSAPHPATLRNEPLLLYESATSAYRARLAADGASFVLILDRWALRLTPGAPVERLELPANSEAVWTPAGLAVWREGSIELIDAGNGRSRQKVDLSVRPRAFTAWHHAIAWLERSPDGASVIRSGSAKEPLYRSGGTIETLTMLSDWVFFVERSNDGWRIGAVPSAGGSPRFVRKRAGRTPSSLVRDGEALYYYDGNVREVRRLEADLEHESVVGRGGVCSPLAARGAVFCARVGGIFELSPGAPERPLVAAGAGRLITSLAATESHVAWVSEAGTERLEVHAVERRRE